MTHEITLVLPQSIAAELMVAAVDTRETAAVLLAGSAGGDGPAMRLLGRELHWIPDHAYLRRESDALTVASTGYVPALGRAAEIGSIALWVHTHPGQEVSVEASDKDCKVDTDLAEVFRLRTGSDLYGSLIFGRGRNGLAFTGWLGSHEMSMQVTRLWVVGDRLRLARAHGHEFPAQVPQAFDRNVRAFGGGVQAVLGDLRVGVVGCGGTGSAVAEQLVRLGVRHFQLFDADALSESNVTRVYGSTPQDIGRPKVDVLADHLAAIAPDVEVSSLASLITVESTARHLSTCDAVFGCTDDNAGRLVLSRLAYYYLVPVFDCGVVLSSDAENLLTGINGRVTILGPPGACLICRGRIDLQRAATEVLTPEERERRVDEGYAPGLHGVEPAVVTFTTLVAASAVNELLERLTGYGPEGVPTEILLRIHEREVSANAVAPRPGHYCDPEAGKLGRGDTDPFLEQTWVA
jgi:ThiF family